MPEPVKNQGTPQVPESGPFPGIVLPAYAPPQLVRGPTDIDPKLASSVYGTAASTLTWTLLAQFNHAVSTMQPETLATVVGATAILIGGALGYATKNR